jgi:cytochrome c peroxidase
MMQWTGAPTAAERDEARSWIRKVRQAHYATGDADAAFQSEPLQPLPLTVSLDEEKVALGNELYHDNRLSGDDSLSCATGHGCAQGGTDQGPSSTGIEGPVGPVNSPTT